MTVIDEKEIKKIVGDLTEVFNKHKLTLEEMRLIVQRLNGEINMMITKNNSKQMAEGLMGTMLRKYLPGGGK